MKERRIALVCTSLRAGGAERIICRLASHFVKENQASIFTLSSGEAFYDLPDKVQVVKPRMSRRRKSVKRFSALRELRRALQAYSPHALFSFGGLINSAVRLATFGIGAKTYLCNRASPVSNPWRGIAILNRVVYPFADGAIVQTEYARQIMSRTYPFTCFHVIPNPIEIPESVSTIEERERNIAMVGTLGGKKNQEALIRCFAKVPDHHGWKLQVIGDGPDRSRLERLSDELGVSQSVQFLGQRKDVDRLLQKAKIFAFTSLTEGFPNALAEALAAGCACISFDCPTGPSDLIRHGENGILIENGNEVAFRSSLAKLMADENMQRKFSGNARSDIIRFDSESILARFEALC